MGWRFTSFDLAALQRLFARPSGEARELLLGALEREQVERALGRGKLSYEGLALHERVALDRFISAVFADASVARTFGARAATTHELDEADAAALADAADLDAGGCLLRLLVAGRRLGGRDIPVGGIYVVYAPGEVGHLLKGLGGALRREPLDAAAAAPLRKHLIPALDRTAQEGRALFAALPMDESDELDRLLTAGVTEKIAAGTAQQARHQLLVLGDVDAALATLAALVDKAGPTERERTLAELVDLCARYGRLDEARGWRAKLG